MGEPTPQTAQGDLKIADYTSFVSGPYRTKLLEDMEADIKIRRTSH